MAKATKKITVSQVELGKEVNEREQKLKDQIKLLKEQNTCLAKRCKALEDQRDNLEEKVSDLDKIITAKDIDINKLEKTLESWKGNNQKLLDKIRNLEFSRDCIIAGAYKHNEESISKAVKPYIDNLRKEITNVDILQDYYINKMSIANIMKKYSICESSVRRIVFHDNTTHEKDHTFGYPYGSGNKPYGEV